LLNVGPRGADAQIPDQQLARLDWLAAFMRATEPALRATRPWVSAGSGSGDAGAAEVRYTARDRDVFALVRAADERSTVSDVVLPGLHATSTTSVCSLDGSPLQWDRTAGGGVRVTPPEGLSGDVPVAFQIRDAEAVDSGPFRSS
jgi:alpha-L-fucosidase